MWKKYEKVDLRSDFYKTKKTPQKQQKHNSKSPKFSSINQQQASAQKVDPFSLFQKVCCPNCRYIFKIIKNTEVLRSSTPVKKPVVFQRSIQTDPIRSNSPQKVVGTITRQEESVFQTQRKSTSSIFKPNVVKQSNHNKSSNIHESDHLKSSTFQFPERSPNRTNKSIRKSNQSNLDVKNSSILKQSSSRTISVVDKKEEKRNEQISQNDKEAIEKLVKAEMKKDLAKLPELLNSQLKNTKTIDHLTYFYTDLPSSIEIPSYFKMLINDYHERKPHQVQTYTLKQK